MKEGKSEFFSFCVNIGFIRIFSKLMKFIGIGQTVHIEYFILFN